MGYKRAGFQVLGNCEIDKQINQMYVKNMHPKYNYNMDVREFNKLEDLPEELYHLDILDGSPPCSTFSTAGLRDKAWGKEKVFREGQAKQRLDDLFFAYLDTVERLNPKVAVAENVTGIIKGDAKGYVNEISKRFKELGYSLQIFRLNAAFMNVPQTRERVFFIANNQGFSKLNLNFNSPISYFGQIRSKQGGSRPKEGTKSAYLLSKRRPGDKKLSEVSVRLGGKDTMYSQMIVADNAVCPTLVSGGKFFRDCDGTEFTAEDIITVQTFPYDYNFVNYSTNNIQYVCGMSVPPNMMANIATEIWKQWLSK